MATGKKIVLVTLQGSYGLERAEELAEELKAAFTANAGTPKAVIELDLSGVTELDLSAIQLFYAAKKSATAKGGDLLLVGALKPALSARLRSSTLISAAAADGPALAAALPSFLATGAYR
jgi:anti-anti-sigma regulatory factor